MFIATTKAQEVAKVFKLLKIEKNSGHNGISNAILKCFSPNGYPISAKKSNEIIQKSKYRFWLKLEKVTLLLYLRREIELGPKISVQSV